MKLTFSTEDELFRSEVANWLSAHLVGEFEPLRFRGGPGDEHMFTEERKAWEQQLAKGGWTCIGWAQQDGGRGATIEQQVIFHEEYARAGGPGRVGHIGEGLAGPTIAMFGSDEQKKRYLPGIVAGKELWCQGYSEPDAGSDLAAVKTKASYNETNKQWEISGQKVWTSLAMDADWCFVIARCESGSTGHKGLGFFLVNMAQAEVQVRPIKQLTGTCEFNEVFFDNAIAADIIGEPGDGWRIAIALLGLERGVSTLGQQMLFQNELNEVIELAKANGMANNSDIRQRIAKAHSELTIMRYNSLRMLSANDNSRLQKEALVYKLYWASWHRDLGKLAMDVLGPESEILTGYPYDLTRLQSLFLFTRADTIYGGTNEIQRNIIAERGLGMPKEPKC
ncbi:acyl-CoA dehydrogenase family protein [Vibrio alfacsensis]|uniref:acyl-CoA dehydrogenase family protein n=1 Tax=Vibrio alfacsensis TaxID=1074311 RepID=UPI004067CC52